jgi:hypothetical protein
MPYELTDPLALLSFSSMPIQELCEHHRSLLAALRQADHWHRLITSRIDLAVASVADLGELQEPQGALGYSFHHPPPQGLRELVGIISSDVRLHETSMLMRLRTALSELDAYIECLRDMTGEAANTIVARVGSIQIAG